jgi:hypothetical protein
MQIWTGCSNMIPLAAVSAPEESALSPELVDVRQADLATPRIGQTFRWEAHVSHDVSVARIEAPPATDQIPHDLRVLEHQVSAGGTEMKLPSHKFPIRKQGKTLWAKVSSPKLLEDSVHPSPNEPQDMKFRVWLQPLEDAPGHQVASAPWRSFSILSQQDPTGIIPPLVIANPDALAPDTTLLATAGLGRHESANLGQPCAMEPAETEYTIYPAFRRLPSPVLSLS